MISIGFHPYFSYKFLDGNTSFRQRGAFLVSPVPLTVNCFPVDPDREQYPEDTIDRLGEKPPQYQKKLDTHDAVLSQLKEV